MECDAQQQDVQLGPAASDGVLIGRNPDEDIIFSHLKDDTRELLDAEKVIIVRGIEAIQDVIIQKDHRFSKAMIPAGTLHITLLVTYLGNEEVSMAVCAMTEMKDTLLDILQEKELVLPFRGIGHFRSEVAFVQMAEGEHVTTLRKIAETLKKRFEEKGILVTDSKAFKPHLTFMKLSKAPKLRSQVPVKKKDAIETLKKRFEEKGILVTDSKAFKPHLTFMKLSKAPKLRSQVPVKKKDAIGEKHVAEPDDAELVSLSKRLVENAVLKAVQQYLEETQLNKHRHADVSPSKTEENLNDNEHRK
ncbi:UNVERIFIED_CONTAM: hypothetical protein FKN15_009542 [Acipenser sinensis]